MWDILLFLTEDISQKVDLVEDDRIAIWEKFQVYAHSVGRTHVFFVYPVVWGCLVVLSFKATPV